MNRFLWILVAVMTLVSCSSSKTIGDSPVLNTCQFEALEERMQEEERLIAIFLHADWCRFCRNMEQTTFQDPRVISRLNQDFYFISFDGEYQGDVVFRNHIFRFERTGQNTGTHQLASALGAIDGVLTYPSFIILNAKYEIIFQNNTFLNAEDLALILDKAVN